MSRCDFSNMFVIDVNIRSILYHDCWISGHRTYPNSVFMIGSVLKSQLRRAMKVDSMVKRFNM